MYTPPHTHSHTPTTHKHTLHFQGNVIPASCSASSSHACMSDASASTVRLVFFLSWTCDFAVMRRCNRGAENSLQCCLTWGVLWVCCGCVVDVLWVCCGCVRERESFGVHVQTHTDTHTHTLTQQQQQTTHLVIHVQGKLCDICKQYWAFMLQMYMQFECSCQSCHTFAITVSIANGGQYVRVNLSVNHAWGRSELVDQWMGVDECIGMIMMMILMIYDTRYKHVVEYTATCACNAAAHRT